MAQNCHENENFHALREKIHVVRENSSRIPFQAKSIARYEFVTISKIVNFWMQER